MSSHPDSPAGSISRRRAVALRAHVRLGAALLVLAPAAAACGGSRAAEPVSAAAVPVPAVAPVCTDTTDLVIAATTDVHGRLRAWDYYANRADSTNSLAGAATIIDSVRAANPGRVILLDAGDLLQGNPLAYVAARVSSDSTSPIVAAMNAMQYDATAVGNHEFNYGVPHLDRVVAQSRFPWLSANTRRSDGGPAFPAYRIVERAGVRVALVGATTPGVMVWDQENVKGRMTIGDIVPAVRSAVAEARAAGAEVVVVTVHSGFDGPASYDTVSSGLPSENVAGRLATEVDGIDLVVFGHSHRELKGRIIGTTQFLQPKNWAASVGVVHLPVAGCATGAPRRVVQAASRSALIRIAGHAEHAAVLAATQRMHEETVRYVTTAIGRTTVAWRGDSARVADTPLIDLILEVERRATGADLASTAAFTLDGGLDAGPITVAELARLYPYDNTLRAVRVTGAQLRAYLEHSARYYRVLADTVSGPLIDPSVPGYNFDIIAGADYTLDLSKPVGMRVTALSVKGRRVRDTDSFTLALNNYRQTGGGGYAMLRDAPVVYDKNEEIRQLLIDEVTRRGTIRPADVFRRNWRLVPAAAVARAYREGRPTRSEGRGAGIGASAGSGAGSVSAGGARSNGGPPPPGSSPATGASAASNGRAPQRFTAAPGRHLRLITTNDFHGALEARPDSRGVMLGGAATLAGAIDEARRECRGRCETLLVDGGDMFQGTPASNLSYGKPVVELFNTLGYAATAVGNHEFDWGQDTLRARLRETRYGVLGANVRYADGRDVEWIPNDTIVVRGKLRIGIVGVASPETPSHTRPIVVQGLRFDDAVPIVDSITRVLRSRGVDAVIVLTHMGAFCDRVPEGQTAPACNGEITTFANRLTERVDAIISAHTHSRVATTIKGVPIVQAFSSGRAIGVVDVALPARGAKIGGASRIDVRNVRADSVQPVPRIAQLVADVIAPIAARVNAPVAEIATAMPRSGDQYALGNLVADAQRWAGKTDLAVTNNAGIRANLAAGTATFGTLFELQPFDNTLHHLTVSGANLRVYLGRLVAGSAPRVHVSGVTVNYDRARPAGARITAVRLADGRPLDDAATYTITMNDYLAGAAEGLVLAESASSRRVLDVADLAALVGYLKQLPQPVVAPAEPRLIGAGAP